MPRKKTDGRRQAERDADMKTLLESLRPMAEQYQREFLNRHVILDTDTESVDVLWLKRNFMHLCGLDYDVPLRKYKGHRHGTIVKSEQFFDDLADGSISPRDVRHHHAPGITADKKSVLSAMLRTPSSLDEDGHQGGIVDSQSDDYKYFFGTDEWCVGIIESEESRVDPDVPVFFPRTLRKGPITGAAIKRKDTGLRVVTNSRIIPPRSMPAPER